MLNCVAIVLREFTTSLGAIIHYCFKVVRSYSWSRTAHNPNQTKNIRVSWIITRISFCVCMLLGCVWMRDMGLVCLSRYLRRTFHANYVAHQRKILRENQSGSPSRTQKNASFCGKSGHPRPNSRVTIFVNVNHPPPY